jgi:hypothetical protein
MLAECPLVRVAAFASYTCQRQALNLKPNETPPCHCNDPARPVKREEDAARLQRRMRRLGISKWDPDPIKAPAEARKARKRARDA